MERYRIHADAHLYYCTFTVVDWLPVFVSDLPCQLVLESLSHCVRYKQLGLDAFVIMPTHVHLIIYDRQWNSGRLELTLEQLRAYTGRQLAQYCRQACPSCFADVLRRAAGPNRGCRFWQPTRHPVFIDTESFHDQKRDYLHDNPRRKGLVLHPAHWRWSSASWYEQRQECGVPIEPIGW